MASRIALVLLLVIGSASALNLPNFQLPGSGNPAQIVCTAIQLQKQLAVTIVQRIQTTLSRPEFRNRFPLTIAYLSQEGNIGLLTQNTNTCAAFFVTLRQKFQEDLKNNNMANQAMINQLMQWLNNPTPVAPGSG